MGTDGDQFSQNLGQVLREVYRAFSKELEGRISECGVSLSQWYFLRILWEEDGISQRELSERVGLVEPATTTAVSALERRGIVVRRAEAADRRRRLVFLTPLGLELRDRLLPMAGDVNLKASESLGDKADERLRKILKTIRGNLDRSLER